MSKWRVSLPPFHSFPPALLNSPTSPHPTRDEYDFVLLPQDDPPTAASSPFLLESHKLGIGMSILKPLFKEAHALFHTARRSANEKEGNQQQPHKSLVDATRALLLINPDMYTAWNVRKQLILQHTLYETDELVFLDLVFTKHTKKACAWAHRRWCLARLPESKAMDHRRVMHELALTARIAELFPKNYYAWTHRWWVVDRVPGEGVLREQVAFAQEWGGRHVWDMSAVNFLHHVLARLVRQHSPLDAGTVLEEVLGSNARQLDSYPGHEALWYQRRGLLVLWLEATAGASGLLEEEMARATHYLEKDGPFVGKEGLLWDEASRGKQRRCAWAHQCWVVVRLGGGKDDEDDDRVELGRELDALEKKGAVIPPGYRAL